MLPLCLFYAACAASTAPKSKHQLLGNPMHYILQYVCWVPHTSCTSKLPMCPFWHRHSSCACCATPQPRHAYCHNTLPTQATRLLAELTPCAALFGHTVCNHCPASQCEARCLVTQSVSAKPVTASLGDPVLLGHVAVDIHLNGLLNNLLGLLSTQDLINTHSLRGSTTTQPSTPTSPVAQVACGSKTVLHMLPALSRLTASQCSKPIGLAACVQPTQSDQTCSWQAEQELIA